MLAFRRAHPLDLATLRGSVAVTQRGVGVVSNDEEELARLRARVAELESKPAASTAPSLGTPPPAAAPPKRNSFASGFLGCLGVGAALVAVFIVLASMGRCTQQVAATNASVTNAVSATNSAVAAAPATAAPVTAWTYSASTDAMNDAQTRTACVTSNNEVTQTFPYKDVDAQLCIRKSPRYGLDAYVQLNGDGQILCDIEGCSLHVRFDKGAAGSFPAVSAADNSTNIIFIRRTPALIEALKRSSTTVVEVRLYQNGDQDLRFDTAGLRWP